MGVSIRNMTSVYFQKDDQLLCLFRIGSRVADKLYVGAAGGHFEENEMPSPEACVLREMNEELGLTENDIEGLALRYITSRLKNGEIRMNYYFFADLKTDKPLKSSEGTLKWIPFSAFPALPMPVSAKHMILHYLKEGRHTSHLYAGITQEEETFFTVMKEFQTK